MTERANTPKLRFPEFNNDWTTNQAKNLFTNVSDKKHDGDLLVLSATQDKGMVPRQDLDLEIKYDKKNLSNYKRTLPNDFIISLRSFQGGFELNTIEGIVSPAYTVLRGEEELAQPKFFKQYFKSIRFIKKLDSMIYGIRDGKSISYKEFSTFSINYPSILEQQKIGDFFSKLDRQIELEEQKLAKLEEQKKGYMQKIFSQELRFKNENGNNYPDWEVKKIGEIMDVASVKRIHQSDWTNEGVRFIRARDIVSRYKGKIVEDPLFISKERYEEYSKLSGKVKIGDLLVTGVGTIGVPLLINNEKPIYFKDGNIIWLKNEDNIDKNFLFYSFISRKTQNFIKSVAGIGTVGTYTISNAKKTPILLPVSIEQVKIGNFFNELDKSIKKQNKKVDLLKERKKGFLQKMFV
ncbi:MAG: restriction endonuclease subunit S [Vagococcus sp.]